MKVATTFALSWLSATAIFCIALIFDGGWLAPSGFLFLCGLVATISGIYYFVIGLPVLYFLSTREKVTRIAFVGWGLAASIPMLLFSLYSREIEWIFATILAGLMGGLVFAIRLPNQPGT